MTSIVKGQKYDRQLRLWDKQGQQALEGAHVALLGASALGTETLKNLVLPGIGSFTILDGTTVTEEDVACNFFLTRKDLGASRAEAATYWLGELNDDVQGNSINKSFLQVWRETPEIFSQFTLVILTEWVGRDEAELVACIRFLESRGIPMVRAWSNGYFGAFRLAFQEHTVVESHPENVQDLRLDSPWPALREHMHAVDLDQLDGFGFAHVPWIILLGRQLELWRDKHQGRMPSTFAEKNEIRQAVRSMARPGVDDENIEEAYQATLRACNVTQVPSHVQSILEAPQCVQADAESPMFWKVARAIRETMGEESSGLNGLLPLVGTIPDMKADSAEYMQLQRLYKNKAKEDMEQVLAKAMEISKGIVPEKELREAVELWCKHAPYVRLLQYTPMEGEWREERRDEWVSKMGSWAKQEDPEEAWLIYVGLRAVEVYLGEHGRFPGQGDVNVQEDLLSLVALTERMLEQWGIEGMNPKVMSHIKPYLEELCRSGGLELHSISAFLGGMVGQECIKQITRQYLPLDNTCVYNGIKAMTSVLCLP